MEAQKIKEQIDDIFLLLKNECVTEKEAHQKCLALFEEQLSKRDELIKALKELNNELTEQACNIRFIPKERELWAKINKLKEELK